VGDIEEIECVVIGAGVVGLACARTLSSRGLDVIVLEKEEAIGTQTSARNSEVIHAGIYYEPGSEKARLCRRGRDMLYDYCTERGIGHKRLGKLIVATRDGQTENLRNISENARANGVDDLVPLSVEDARTLEPDVACVAALWSPSTGIVDSHSLMLSYQGDAEASGAVISVFSPVLGGNVTVDRIELHVGGEMPMTLRCRYLVNSAGFEAQSIAAEIGGVPHGTIPGRFLARGVYFTLQGRSPFQHLIYPVPEEGGLGVHVTLDLAGQAKFGPDVEWIDEVDYTVDSGRAGAFYSAIRTYWPGLPDGSLQLGYAGIRPKTRLGGDGPTDFMIQGKETHGVDGLVNLYGIESPGLTASLAIAEEVADRLL